MRPNVKALCTCVMLLTGMEHAAAACSVATSGINFGSYDVFVLTPSDSVGNITVSCNSNEQVTINIGSSPTSGGFSPRQMRHVSLPDKLDYNLYLDTPHTMIWGDGTLGTQTITAKVKKDEPWNVPFYGRIPAQQDVTVGNYSEVLAVTITP